MVFWKRVDKEKSWLATRQKKRRKMREQCCDIWKWFYRALLLKSVLQFVTCTSIIYCSTAHKYASLLIFQSVIRAKISHCLSVSVSRCLMLRFYSLSRFMRLTRSTLWATSKCEARISIRKRRLEQLSRRTTCCYRFCVKIGCIVLLTFLTRVLSRYVNSVLIILGTVYFLTTYLLHWHNGRDLG